MKHKGQFKLVPKDIPLLQLICDATFITRPQIEFLIDGRTEENRDSRNRRLARLATLHQLRIYPQCFPYPGRIFAVTPSGMITLRLISGAIGASQDPNILTDKTQIPYFIGLSQIEVYARKAFEVRLWTGNRELKLLNIASSPPTTRDYDSIAEITSPVDSNVVMRLGIACGLSVPSADRHEQIRKGLDADRQIHRLLYFVNSETEASFVAKNIYSKTVPVGVVVVGQFRTKGPDAETRVIRNWIVVRTTILDFLTTIEPLGKPQTPA